MAKWQHILADSGGSNTVWAFCGHDGTTVLKKTVSLHPKFALQMSAGDWQQLEEDLGDLAGERLIFYGAGCGQETVRAQLAALLREAGFADVEVHPDTLGACRSLLAHDPGTVAILGTGSVLLSYDGAAVVQRVGGFGSLIGDEGGGFHFARLVVKDYLNGLLSEEQLAPVIGTHDEVLARLASPEAQAWLATVAGLVSGLELDAWHERNIGAFLEIYVTHLRKPPITLSVIGSYGFHCRHVLMRLLSEAGISLEAVSDSPIEGLVRYHGIRR